MSVYMNISEGAVEERLGCLETAVHVRAFGTWAGAMSVVGRHFEGAFIVTT
jgi:hypothetical protein